jgi:hypothetical protein
MSSITDFPARGRITAINDDKVTFQPTNSNYEMSLTIPKDFGGKVGSLVDGVIRVAARKVYTVPSGGNFVSPIFGPPRTIQGRVKYVDQKQLVIQAGVPIVVDLPSEDSAMDLHDGGIGVGSLINVVGLPGARFELVGVAAGQG